MSLDAALDEWRRLLGHDRVVTGPAVQHEYGMDASGVEREIPAALRIVDSSYIPAVMQIAYRHEVPVYPLSTGHNWGYGTAMPVRDGCTILDLSALRKILQFDAELGVVTVEPGVTQGMLAELLDTGGHPFMVPVTGAGPTCSLLANALERGYGVTPYTDHFGAVTDIEAVLADGSLYRTAMSEIGSAELARLFRWGIGPYSPGLFTQSGFGIVTRLTFALARRPEAVRACLFSLRDDSLLEPAVERIRQVLSALPGIVGGINLMNRHRVLAMAAPYPADSVGADGLIPSQVIDALGRDYQILPWTGFATLYGTRRVIAAAQREMKALLAGVASRVLFVTADRARMLQRAASWLPGHLGRRLGSTASTLASSLQLVEGRPNETALPLAYWRNPHSPQGIRRDPSRDGCGLIWYAPLVPMRPTSARAYVEMVRQVTRQHRMEPLMTFTSVSDKLFDSTVPLIYDRQQATALADAKQCYRSLVEAGRPLGFYPYRLGVDSMSYAGGESTHAGRWHARLRRAVDPHDILSPGRYA